LVEAGEISGMLDAILNRLADFSEQEEKTRQDILSALTYPALIVSVGLLTIYALLTYVVPKLTTMFEEMGEVLPLPTQILISLSNMFKAYWWLAVLLSAAGLIFLKRNKSSAERFFWHRLMLNLPLVGGIMQKTEIAHFARTLGLLFESGVAMLAGLGAVSETITNEVIKLEIKKITQDIKDGASLSSAIKKCSFFPLYAANIINVGEEAGTLEKSLKRIALSSEQEVSRTIKALTSLIEPIMILLLGLGVTFIVVAMLLPIFQINFMVR
jgi:general secretion pathway protein F